MFYSTFNNGRANREMLIKIAHVVNKVIAFFRNPNLKISFSKSKIPQLFDNKVALSSPPCSFSHHNTKTYSIG